MTRPEEHSQEQALRRVQVKICGIADAPAMTAALDAGADFVGLVFYPPSKRYLSPQEAAPLAAMVRERGIEDTGAKTKTVALFVDPSDDVLSGVLDHVAIDLVQLHGHESPLRVQEIRRNFGLPVMKALRVGARADLDAVDAYVSAGADWLLFDAKTSAGPGGTGEVFDWTLLSGMSCPVPFMLAGGLGLENMAQAVRVVRPDALDVSSALEDRPGHKDPAKIRAFVDAARRV